MTNLSRLVCCMLVLAQPASAQDAELGTWTPPFEIEVVDLPTASNGVDYRLFVRRPLASPREGDLAVGVYILDALWNLPAAAAMHSNVEFLRRTPSLMLIGVGYQNETRSRLEENRTRDYTPTHFSPTDPEGHFLRPVDYDGSGGADRFLTVMRDEIIPFVEQRYGLDPVRRGLVGKSMSGLLATHALLRWPALFSDYLIISPALWWDDYFDDFKDRAVMRVEHETHGTQLARPVRAHFTMGELEERLGMLADVYVLTPALRLRDDPNLHLSVRLMDGEDHEGSFARGYA